MYHLGASDNFFLKKFLTTPSGQHPILEYFLHFIFHGIASTHGTHDDQADKNP
jgi:hypothetical protein